MTHPLDDYSRKDIAQIQLTYLRVYGDVEGVLLFGHCPRCREDVIFPIPADHEALDHDDAGDPVCPDRFPCVKCELKIDIEMFPLPWSEDDG